MGDAVLGPRSSTTFAAASNFRFETGLNENGSTVRTPRRFLRVTPVETSARCSSDRHEGTTSTAGGWNIMAGASSSTRRAAMVQMSSALLAVHEWLLGRGVGTAGAVGQGLLAGRIPGLSEPDGEGLRTYRRPDAKSGGHGVGWSPIIPYTFKVPTDWQEVPVSIADLGGTEIDLRFQSSSEGNISVVVAPVLRFSSNLGDNVKIEDVGLPQKVIDAFGPELTGATVEGKVKTMDVQNYDGRTYYQYELEAPHMLVSATAAGNRLYLFSATGNGRQWKKHFTDLKGIRDSFRVG